MTRPGELVAAVLAGSWRPSPPCPPLSAIELAAIAPLLLNSGGASLGWWRIRQSELSTSTSATQLQDAYRLHTLQAAIHERELTRVLTALHSASIDALIFKGWAVAHLYPERGLRPYGDVDLCVRPEQCAHAEAVLLGPAGPSCLVDLHPAPAELNDRSLDSLYARSQLVQLGDVDVRILGPEDHLRLLCLHLLRHGAIRPLWLCDIAVALESRPVDFDWDYCMSGSQRRSAWVACALGLARHLLGARLDNVPMPWRAYHLPRWLVPSVLRQWERESSRPSTLTLDDLRHPDRVLHQLREHWPNPIEATMRLRGRANNLPRLPYQLGDYLVRALLSGAQLERLHARFVGHPLV